MIRVQVLEKKEVREGVFSDLKTKKTVWVDISTPTPIEFKQLSDHLRIEPQELKRFFDRKVRPLLTNIPRYSVIVISLPITENSHISTQPIIIFISKYTNDLISVHEKASPTIDRMLRFDKKVRLLIFEKGTTFILFRLTDEILLTYYNIMETLMVRLEDAENLIFNPKKNADPMKDLFEIKKSMIIFRKAVSANREVLSAIEKEYGEYLEKKDLSKFRILNSECTRLIELADMYRDIITSSIEMRLSQVSNMLNITMKKLTAWGALILVPSLIAGFYGMNFKYMPEIDWEYGYLFAIGVMFASVAALYIYFKTQDWI